jgi:hypothetical protein
MCPRGIITENGKKCTHERVVVRWGRTQERVMKSNVFLVGVDALAWSSERKNIQLREKAKAMQRGRGVRERDGGGAWTHRIFHEIGPDL